MSRGLFVTVDGSGGVGKTTTLTLAVESLRGHGLTVHPTREPSDTPVGQLIRNGTETYRGLALAHLVVGDRHHHVATEVAPRVADGAIVLCDRYIPSSLVLQRLDGIGEDAIWAMNADLPTPDLAFVLTATPAVVAARLASRGSRNSRFERQPDSSNAEVSLYHQAVSTLRAAGWNVHTLDCTAIGPEQAAMMLTAQILALHAEWSTGEPLAADVQHR